MKRCRFFLLLCLAAATLVLALAFARAASQSDAHPVSDDPTLLSHTVSAGYDHTCGVKTDGTLACWGLNDQGQGAVRPHPAGVITASADLAEGAGGGRRLPVLVPPPAGQGAVRPHAAGVTTARADGLGEEGGVVREGTGVAMRGRRWQRAAQDQSRCC